MISEGNVVLICTHDRGTLDGRGRRSLPTRFAPKIEVVSKRTRHFGSAKFLERTTMRINWRKLQSPGRSSSSPNHFDTSERGRKNILS